MPRKQQKQTTPRPAQPSKATSKHWNFTRPSETFRFDKVPHDLTEKIRFIIGFGDTVDDLQLTSDWTGCIGDELYHWISKRDGWGVKAFRYPRVYRFFLHFLLCASKFYIEVGVWKDIQPGVDVPALGRFYMWLVQGFVKEVLSLDVEITATWRSKILHPFICRLFYDIPEQEPVLEDDMVLAHALYLDPNSSQTKPKREDFALFYKSDLLVEELKNGQFRFFP